MKRTRAQIAAALGRLEARGGGRGFQPLHISDTSDGGIVLHFLFEGDVAPPGARPYDPRREAERRGLPGA